MQLNWFQNKVRLPPKSSLLVLTTVHEVDWIFAGHCTGFDGLRRIANEHGKRFARIHTGSMIRFPIKDATNPVSTIPTVERDIHRSYQE